MIIIFICLSTDIWYIKIKKKGKGYVEDWLCFYLETKESMQLIINLSHYVLPCCIAENSLDKEFE